MTVSCPPRVADWLLRRLASGSRRDSMIGDLHEQYGRGRSVAWYWRQTITTILTGALIKQRILWGLVPTIVTAAMTAALSYFFMPTRFQSEAVLVVMPQMVSDPPPVPEAPVGPSKAAVNAGGTLAGVGLGLVMVSVSNKKKPSTTPPE